MEFFDKNFARNVTIFGVDNSSSSHSDNHKKDFLIADECLTNSIDGSLGHQRKSLILILLKQTQKFVWVYIKTLIIVIWCLIEKKSLNLNLTIKMWTLNFSILNFFKSVLSQK